MEKGEDSRLGKRQRRLTVFDSELRQTQLTLCKVDLVLQMTSEGCLPSQGK